MKTLFSYPLSPMQQGMLMHNLHEARPGYYVEQMVCHLPERLDVATLAQSWQQVVEQHPILRTSFHLESEGQLRQAVCEQIQLPIQSEDWQGLSKTVQEERLVEFLRQDRLESFDITVPPLMRLAIFQQGEADYILVWTFHHALLDGRSITFVLKDVFALYDSSTSEEPSVLPNRRPYQDYVDWLSQQSFADTEPFWRNLLQGFQRPTPLVFTALNGASDAVDDLVSETFVTNSPSDTTEAEDSRYGRLKVQLSPSLTAALEAFSQQHQLTLNTLLQGAWADLLSRYSEQSDVVFGATRACRHGAIDSLESMVGLFMNTVPLRIQVQPEKEVLPWLRNIRNQWLALRDYERTPLLDIQRWSDVPGGLPLFNSLLIFDNTDFSDQLRAEDDHWTNRTVELWEQPHYPLVLNVYGGSALTLKLHFDRHVLDEATAGRLLAYLETLLQGFVEQPQQQVKDLPLLTAAEQQQLSADLDIQSIQQDTQGRSSCFVVGDGVLPLSCLNTLHQLDYQILGIYSTDGSLQAWAAEHHIPHAASRAEFRQQLLSQSYDYLFSINNVQWIIPADVLAQAQRATINYHDSPLPKYAGLYATSWALLNGETQHAVTWHEVTPDIDAGRVFKQKTVPIFAEDTVFNLNTRCFDAAVSSFSELARELATLQVEPQIQDLAERSYFGPSDRPAAASLLSFDSKSQDICNLVRALDFGPVRNQMGIPKLWLDSSVVAVGTAKSVPIAQGVPGQVLQMDSEGICVATADGAVMLGRLTTLEGKDLSIAEVTEAYGLHVGMVLPSLDPDTRTAISLRNAAICRHENVWAERLIQAAPFLHPYLGLDGAVKVQPSPHTPLHRFALALPPSALEPKALLAMFAAYCARLSSESEFDLGLQTDAQRSVAPEIFSQRVPFRVQTRAGETFSDFKARFDADLEGATRFGSFRYSLLRRYAALQAQPQGDLLPVAIVMTPSPSQLDWQHLGATLALVAYTDGSQPELVHAGAIQAENSQAMVDQLQTLIGACIEQPAQLLQQLPLLSSQQAQRILVDWNQTVMPYPQDSCIHELFEQQVTQRPEAIAVAFADRQLTYEALNEQANQLAHYLQQQGVGPDVMVGLHMERSIEMMVGLLAIHKAGGAYVPLDPDFPADRLVYMVEDSQAPVVLTQQSLMERLPVPAAVRVIAIDGEGAAITTQPTTNPSSGVKPENLSYVIYTSGSTGRPKGVMVEHRNVVNFFTGMDQSLEHEPPGVWLAVTSLSFDISVLELFWTLARGFKVVIYSAKQERQQSPGARVALQHADKTIDFSLFYFSSDESANTSTNKYRLLMEGAQFADTHGFKAVWTPERHFHAFGGLFPNPAVTSAAIAATTKNVKILAGSCVSPLHSSIRIAEDWSLVDNLSGGRVGISFAAGWQPNDFVLRPETFADRKDIMFEQIEEVKSLWRGEAVNYPNGKGDMVAVRTLPRPIQQELPIWVTAAGNPETFRQAGEKGFHLLTHLLGQSLEELASKIAIYRQAWTDSGHPGRGCLTLMLHTFVGSSTDEVREIVRQPMRQYLGSSLDLIKQAAWSFPTFKQQTTTDTGGFSMAHLSDAERDAVLDFSFERYFETSGLFGTVEDCLATADRLKGIDIDEIACLIDYGVNPELVLAQLPLLNQVRDQAQRILTEGESETQNLSVASLIARHQVTHLQCTPSMANLLISEASSREAMGSLRAMMVGGEAFSESLALQLKEVIGGKIHNMYGPTETTIWSATHTLDNVDGVVPIGRAIANTDLYILDANQQPVPVGVGGELYIGGAGVTRGYLNRPELTTERFVPYPFSDDPQARLYRTGDLVRYRTDGNIEFLGRIDFQVKVRGYRIELGEIETLLSRHEAVQEAVVVAREDSPGSKRLVGYLITKPGATPVTAELRDFLLAHLPEYMVPSNFVVMDAFPLTPNRKVDRKALPAPTQATLDIQPGSGTAAQTATEERLIALWRNVLQVSDIGPDDNFFDAGGNSLIAVALISEVRAAFNVDLPLISLFQAPTVSRMAQRVEDLQLEQMAPDELSVLIAKLEQLSDVEVSALLQSSAH
jgi:natural product biosynthesis luciferase-like monooxygenase protein